MTSTKSLSMVIQDTHCLPERSRRISVTDGSMQQRTRSGSCGPRMLTPLSVVCPKGMTRYCTATAAIYPRGQGQLLAIARAAISRPPVLILDEATSSIDTRTERLIEKGMDRLMENRTVLSSHIGFQRCETQRQFLCWKGHDHRAGDHESCWGKRSRYYRLYTGQFELE